MSPSSWGPPPLPARVAASRHLPFVGRRRELRTLETAWAEVVGGHRQVVLVGGEPGAGKTRLVAEAAGALHDDGVAVLVGTSSLDAALPYQPFAEMLDHLVATTPEGALAHLVGDRARELRHLSPQLEHRRPSARARAGLSGAARRDLFDAVTQVFTVMAEDRPLALFLDDLHWAQLPTLALLEHVVQATPDARLLVLATFRTTVPDRSDEIAARVAELHRFEGVRRIDLGGLDTDDIAQYVSLRSGLPLPSARRPASLLRDRTGGNPFFLRELWADLEQHGGISALRMAAGVPASIGDTLAARVANLDLEVRRVVELAAVIGQTFDLATLLAASGTGSTVALGLVDSAMAAGLIEVAEPDGSHYSFVHSLTRQAVLDRMPRSERTLLHARVAEVLEAQPAHASLVPRLAQHYLAAELLGFHDRALRYSTEAGRLAERSLAFEEAANWFERAASLTACPPAVRAELLLAAASDYVRACHFLRARAIYEQLDGADPSVRLSAAMGFEDASWRPGLLGSRAADLLSSALEVSELDELDPLRIRALASLGRALALAGQTDRSRQVGAQAIELGRRCGDEGALAHALQTSMWHGTTPDIAELQLERVAEVQQAAKARRDYELLGAAANFGATVNYLVGRPGQLEEAVAESYRSGQATGQPYFRHVYCCLAHSSAFRRGDFEEAERWAEEALRLAGAFDDEMAEGPYGVQMFMIRRETAGLEQFRPFLDGRESFAGRWVPGLLALYTELGIEPGIRRGLRHLMQRDLAQHTREASWPMELVFMVEAALAIRDMHALGVLRPLLDDYRGKNLAGGTLIATFGSAERFLGRISALCGERAGAERAFETALEMDRRMGSVVHVAETLAHQALLAADSGHPGRAQDLARQARDLAEPTGQRRVLRTLEPLASGPTSPDGLTERELAVLRLLAAGLSNQEIGTHLHISANTAANHVRSILAKTGSANRTQAAMYAAQRRLV